jgi:hypothetical protein
VPRHTSSWSRRSGSNCSPGAGGYVDTMSEVEDDRVRATYGEKYPRLARITTEYDPQNLLHRNLNILPA